MIVIAVAIALPLALYKPWPTNKGSSGLIPEEATTITPSDNSAQVNLFTPPLNQPFDYASGKVKIRGVNLGGWLVLEPFITPSIFEPYVSSGVVDEWTLCAHLGREASKTLLEKHYASWVTEDTFVQIKNLGLNHVRIPIGHWAMGYLTEDEPYVPDIAWKYLLRAIEWARKYGIRVMIELHAAPGSQNGWNHSGRLGQINWINGTMGTRNAQRTILYLQYMANFFSNPSYIHVSPLMGLLNEPAAFAIGPENVKRWYQQFLVFNSNLIAMNQSAQIKFVCEQWGADSIRSTRTFGPTMVGEFSVAVNDCAQYLNGIGTGSRWEGTFPDKKSGPTNKTCANENDASSYSVEYKTFLARFFNAQLDAFEQGVGWFYWNFKTENNPLWSYFDGVEYGWIPKDVNDRGPSFCTLRNRPQAPKS
ncbi:hypothetical protein BGZ65_010142 [Modicella reniformis]|uniref:glucan 1,3-beta-glucosidase n=1 Tax=Modicella reniformis TaxID=1440133 RepID=A0A9P6LTH6_9FUNG|nr:hypothetical protein BGZ65_010142 [Modicella reniformis]